MIQDFLPVVFILLLALGVASSIIPVIPSMLYMYFITILFAMLDGFQRITPFDILIFSIILLVSILVDIFSGMVGAKFGGASKKGILYGFLGMIFGFAIAPPFGAFLGIFGGVLIAELSTGRDEYEALKAAGASLLGTLTGTVINTFLAFAYLVLFAVFIFI
ncbi:MAG: DUF456 domain-containing protein [Candidatus Taylorbacteria bacterium]|nr:DUF456 domain-containing protein [Candidatus Taylorbacteria bacterium]